MDNSTLLIVLAIPAAYGILIVSSALLAGSIRSELAELAEQLLKEQKWNDDERDTVNFMLDSCMSFAIGLALPLAIIAATIDVLLRKPMKQSRLDADDRFDGMIWRYGLSILAANPLAALISLPLIAISFIVVLAHGGQSAALHAVEEPLMRAGGVVSYRVAT